MFFENMEALWSYEVQGFRLSGDRGESSIMYLPDFYVEGVETPWEDNTTVWVEVKGVMKNKDKDKCERLAIESEHPVLLVQGDPVDEEITLYRKHTPVQKVKFAATSNGLKVIKARMSKPSERLKNAQTKARRKRFGN